MLSVTAIVVAVIPLASQTPAQQKPSFEVASIKPNVSGDLRVSLETQAGGRFTATNVSLKMLITNAYHVLNFQVLGGPDWINKDRWDVLAKAEDGTMPSTPSAGRSRSLPDSIQVLTQALIEDRFRLRMHRETRQLSVYDLVIAKDGLRMKLSEDQTPPAEPAKENAPQPFWGGSISRGNLMMGPSNINARAITVSDLVGALSFLLGRTVIDKTKLAGFYDVNLQWTPDIDQPMDVFDPTLPFPRHPDGPSIYTALQDQLGLRLVSAKGPVPVIVIDSVQKPSVN
jgi:uncharacterized protein (TIGR03435 family)